MTAERRTLHGELEQLLEAAKVLGVGGDGRVEFSVTTNGKICCMVAHGRMKVPYPIGHGKTPTEAAKACVDDVDRMVRESRKGRRRRG